MTDEFRACFRCGEHITWSDGDPAPEEGTPRSAGTCECGSGFWSTELVDGRWDRYRYGAEVGQPSNTASE